MNTNPVGWFEIPVSNMERAIKFYQSALDVKLSRNQFGVLDMAWFPWDQTKPGATGSLAYNKEFYEPSQKAGVLIYLSCEDVAEALKRIDAAGGKTLVRKKLIKEDIGYMGVFLDSEGNRMALHSRK